MYEPGKILVLGGARPGATQAESSTEKIDLNLPSPQWTAGAPMNYPRQQATATLLADGQVLVTNGTRSPGEPDASYESPGNAVLPSEIWNPATDTWTVVASSPEARTYHSNALLMPDGRVLVNGGGQGGGGQQPNKNPGVPDHPNADLFSPPYLSGGTRPAILGGGPALIHYQRHFTVLPRKGSQIQAFTLVRLGATTHAFNENQRFVRLSFTSPSPPSFDVVGPANANVAPPGHYLLFAIGTNGVPSMGRVVRVAP
jgi:hypothetical protein